MQGLPLKNTALAHAIERGKDRLWRGNLSMTLYTFFKLDPLGCEIIYTLPIKWKVFRESMKDLFFTFFSNNFFFLLYKMFHGLLDERIR